MRLRALDPMLCMLRAAFLQVSPWTVSMCYYYLMPLPLRSTKQLVSSRAFATSNSAIRSGPLRCLLLHTCSMQ